MDRDDVIPRRLTEEIRRRIHAFAETLSEAAPGLAADQMSEDEFKRSGLFHAAIERLRGTQAATVSVKQEFVSGVLDRLKQENLITGWKYAGGGERHDYEVTFPGNHVTAIETKGCLDGNNTNIFVRPPHAEKFVIWSLCQNPGANPVRNAWSGIHTRLSAEIVSRRVLVDGVVIWDMICGTHGRPCPKLAEGSKRQAEVNGLPVPPPCIYLFPRTVPDARNNPAPEIWTLDEIPFLKALSTAFGCDDSDITSVGIKVKRDAADLSRRTILTRGGITIYESNWGKLRRANV